MGDWNVGGGAREVSTEEEDLLKRCKKKAKEGVEMETADGEDRERSTATTSGSKKSYKDFILGDRKKDNADAFADLDMGEVLDDDLIEENIDGSWFGIGMTREEKNEARRPWRNSLIVKLVGRSISYHFLW